MEVDDIVARLIGVLEETGQLENAFMFLTPDKGANEDLYPDNGFQPWRGRERPGNAVCVCPSSHIGPE